jgi:hypothetical protein
MPVMARKKTTDDTGSQKATGDRHKPRRTLALTPEMYDQLAAIASANNRPLLWEARAAIRAHIAAETRRLEEEARRKQG